MNLVVIEDDDEKIILEYKDIKCSFCNNKDIVIQQKYKDVCLNKKGIKEFLKKEVYIKKNKYRCKKCNKIFTINTLFPDRIFDENLKPILRIMLDKNLLKVFEMNENILKKLNIDDKWSLLRANKTLTVINIYTLEIREFLRVLKNKTETKFINGKQVTFITKEIEYSPFERKRKDRITYRRK